MNVPNWQHHSKKQSKWTVKPHAIRSHKAALKALIRKLNVYKA